MHIVYKSNFRDKRDATTFFVVVEKSPKSNSTYDYYLMACFNRKDY